MNNSEFVALSNDLRKLAAIIPLHWGAVQNNRTDDKINMFEITSYPELETQIARLPKTKQNYLRRRWYLWKCAQCDEFLFYSNENVIKNPNQFDKAWDIRINGTYEFDVKGTVIPQSMRSDVESLLKDPSEMVNFYYNKQSTGRRYDIQNRLFIVHHSYVDPTREFYLRCAWGEKKKIYKEFCENVSKIRFINTHNVTAAVIFILEKELEIVDCKIAGL